MKKLITLATSLIIMVSLAACSTTKNEEQMDNSQSITQDDTIKEQTPQDLNTVTIEHSKGVTEVSKNPQKLAIFDFSVLDTLDILGVEVELALPISSIPTYLSKYESIATNAGDIKEPDIEAIFNFEPDIIFISGRQADFYDELNKIAPTVYVDLNSETYMKDLTYNVSYLCEIFETEIGYSELEKINNKIAEVYEKASATDEKALFVMVNSGVMSTYGSGSRFGIVFDVLGVKQADENIEVSTHGQEISYEYIAEVNPDIIFVIDRNEIVGGEVEYTQALDNDLVNSTNAYLAGKIIKLDSEIWYLAGGGLSSVYQMIEEIDKAFE